MDDTNPVIARLDELARLSNAAIANARRTQNVVAEIDVRKVMAVYRDLLEETFPEDAPELNDRPATPSRRADVRGV